MIALVKGSVIRDRAPPPSRDKVCKGRCRRALWSKFLTLFQSIKKKNNAGELWDYLIVTIINGYNI